MAILVVVNNPRHWPITGPDMEVVPARTYVSDPRYGDMRNVRVFNLCKSYRYQTLGYYVSLLAAARGHRPLPSIGTILDLKYQASLRFVSDDLDELIQKSLAPIHSQHFVLSIYFGQNLARRHERLASYLFKLFQAPLLQARFVLEEGKWLLQSVKAIGGGEIPVEHREFALNAARQYFSGRRPTSPRIQSYRYDLAILHDPAEANPPSNERALQRFARAAEAVDLRPEFIDRDDFGRLGEFDALFIRETTAVNHHTYRFARRAESERLVVVDDPLSIMRCTNKVYLAELLDRHGIPMPRTEVLHRDNIDAVAAQFGFPCILKQPDGSFSRGVIKLDTPEGLVSQARELFEDSELLIVQEWLPTSFDWRVGIFNRRPLFVSRYFMAEGHWQIIKRDDLGRSSSGPVETITVEAAPPRMVRTALRAADLIGDGLYGVDLKEIDGRFYVIEVNDNPNIDAGVEDAVLREELYNTVMREFLRRIEERKAGRRR